MSFRQWIKDRNTSQEALEQDGIMNYEGTTQNFGKLVQASAIALAYCMAAHLHWLFGNVVLAGMLLSDTNGVFSSPTDLWVLEFKFFQFSLMHFKPKRSVPVVATYRKGRDMKLYIDSSFPWLDMWNRIVDYSVCLLHFLAFFLAWFWINSNFIFCYSGIWIHLYKFIKILVFKSFSLSAQMPTPFKDV